MEAKDQCHIIRDPRISTKHLEADTMEDSATDRVLASLVEVIPSITTSSPRSSTLRISTTMGVQLCGSRLLEGRIQLEEDLTLII